VVLCKAYFDILNRLDVTHKCDRQTDRRTYRYYRRKCALNYVVQPKSKPAADLEKPPTWLAWTWI